jgi:hypothetical protein
MGTPSAPSLRDRIFPPGPPRDGNIIRIAQVESWESQLIGLGRLTAFVSPRLLEQSHAVDDMALNVVFLQRHRIEVGLKLVLERANDLVPGHRLVPLRDRCEAACAAVGLGADWHRLIDPHDDYIALMDAIDPNAETFRYPFDRGASPWTRDQFVDLVELEAAGSQLQEAILDVVDLLAQLEPLPVQLADAEAVARELADLVGACREVMRFVQEAVNNFQRARENLPLAQLIPSLVSPGVLSGLDAVDEVTLALADRADRMLDRVVSGLGITAPAAPAVPAAPPPFPPAIKSLNQENVQARAMEQMQWFVNAFVVRWTPLLDALNALEARTAAWSEPSCRQLHLDVARFRSRVFNTAVLPTTVTGSGP